MAQQPNQYNGPNVGTNSYTFSSQPRYVQFLVFVTFPFYGSYRLTKRIIYEVGCKAIDVVESVVRTCRQVYRVCRETYAIVAPKVWNGLIYPLFVLPVKTYIIQPTIRMVQFVFDCIVTIIGVTYSITCDVFVAVGNTWSAMWG